MADTPEGVLGRAVGRLQREVADLRSTALARLANAATPTGAVIPFAGSTAPAGWLIADGSAVSRTDYARLFDTIGTTYGSGDGSTTFNIPDVRGLIPVGLDSSQFRFDTLALTGGEAEHALTEAEMPNHIHTWTASRQMQGIDDGNYTSEFSRGDAGASDPVSKDTNAVGGGDPHENMPPYIVLHYIVRT